MTLSIRRAILLFGIVNASLYGALLPLWEGFDEPAHYGYVESLWETHRIPILGQTTLPNDVVASFRFAPVSYLLNRWLREATPYEQWFGLSEAEKRHRRDELNALRPGGVASGELNYEAHQPPLAYILLAVIDRAISSSPISTRILVLRLFAAVSSAVLLFFGGSALCRELRLSAPFADVMLFCMFCSQMFYAATAHVANDWLAVPLAAWTFASVAACCNRPGPRGVLAATACLVLGLLTKAYFLAFGLWAALVAAALVWCGGIKLKPVLAGVAFLFAFAGPWYARNLALYGNVSGTYEAFTGVGVKEALSAIPRINWPDTVASLARNSLWMGNNYGTSFSRATLNTMLVLLALAMALWAARRSAIQPAEQATFAGIAVLIAAIAYATCSSFACRDCGFRGPSPWYTQMLLAPILALAALGMSRWKGIGRVLAICGVALWAWVLLATWVLKLFPMYSGAGSAPVRARDVWRWYVQGAASHQDDLSLMALAPAPWLYAGLVVSGALTVVLSTLVVWKLVKDRAS